MRKWKFYKVKCLAQGYIAVKRQNQDLNPELFDSKISGFNYYIISLFDDHLSLPANNCVQPSADV